MSTGAPPCIPRRSGANWPSADHCLRRRSLVRPRWFSSGPAGPPGLEEEVRATEADQPRPQPGAALPGSTGPRRCGRRRIRPAGPADHGLWVEIPARSASMALRRRQRAGCRPRRTARGRPRRCAAASSTGRPSPTPPGRPPAVAPAPRAGRAELAARPARALGGQRRPAAGGQRPAPAVGRHPGHPKPGRDLPVAGALLDPLGRCHTDPLPPGALLGGQPTTVGIPHGPGIAHTPPPVSRVRNLRR
jgi:hypothetical protein